MDKYERLMEIFSDALKESRDYHIAYIHGIGYASVIRLMRFFIHRRRWRAVCCRIGDGSGIIKTESICKVRITLISVNLIVIYLKI